MFQQLSLLQAIESPATLFEPQFAQRAAIAVALVCLLAAALGPTIILRDLPFFTHAIGAGAYPALVVAVAAGVSLSLASVAGGLVFAGVLWLLTRGSRSSDRRDALTGIAVAAALGFGAVLASTVASGNLRLAVPPEALLFGSVLTVDSSTLIVTAVVAVAVVLTSWLLADRWLAGGFDAGVAAQLGVAKLDAALLLVVALATGATLPITGSLLAGSLLVVPAATARLVTSRAAAMAPVTFLFALLEGALGLYLSLAFDLPAGATIAAMSGAGFVLVAGALTISRFALRGSKKPLAVPLAIVALFALAIGGCGSSSNDTDSEAQGLDVVATSTQVGDLVKQVGGDSVNVTTLLPAGADPHEFEPKPSSVAALSDAAVIFRSGGDIDAWLAPAVKAANNSHKPVDLSNAATLISDSGSANEFNAHWYLSTDNLATAAQRVRDELIKSDPNARETIRANATAYLNDIDAAKEALTACVAKLPKDDRAILTGHDDFDYLAKQFGFRITGQLAETGESEPSVKDVQDAADAARKGGAKALVVSKGEVQQLAVQVANKLDIPLLQLYADSLAKTGPASTALGAIAYNLGAIVKGTSDGAVTCPAAVQP